MQRLSSVDPQSATGRTKDLLESVRQAFGVVPNAVTVMANAPAVLEGFLALSQAMRSPTIGDALHHQVKLATSETNACSYCTSLLSAMGPSVGLSADDILAGRTRSSEDRRATAALAFAGAVLDTRGKVSDAAIEEVRAAGFDDAGIVEIVASVVLGCFTNFLNNVARTELDMPAAAALPGGVR
jgi:alkylhydroperoxidase family enzyme